jgi:hypothetical protein
MCEYKHRTHIRRGQAVSSRQQTTPGKVRVPPQSTGGGVADCQPRPLSVYRGCCHTHTVNLFRSTGSTREYFPRGKSGCRPPRRVVTLEIIAGVMAAVGLESTPLSYFIQADSHFETTMPCSTWRPALVWAENLDQEKPLELENTKGGGASRDLISRHPAVIICRIVFQRPASAARPSSKSRRHDALNTKQARHMPARGLDSLG